MDPLILHHFNVLGIPPTTDLHAIKAAHSKKVKLFHPDKSQSSDTTGAFRAVQEAWEALRNIQLNADHIEQYNKTTAGVTSSQALPKPGAVSESSSRLYSIIDNQKKEIRELKKDLSNAELLMSRYTSLEGLRNTLQAQLVHYESTMALQRQKLEEYAQQNIMQQREIDRLHTVLAEKNAALDRAQQIQHSDHERFNTYVAEYKRMRIVDIAKLQAEVDRNIQIRQSTFDLESQVYQLRTEIIEHEYMSIKRKITGMADQADGIVFQPKQY